jgi:ubiquitin carboxyl-terminal hydrolase L5
MVLLTSVSDAVEPDGTETFGSSIPSILGEETLVSTPAMNTSNPVAPAVEESSSPATLDTKPSPHQPLAHDKIQHSLSVEGRHTRTRSRSSMLEPPMSSVEEKATLSDERRGTKRKLNDTNKIFYADAHDPPYQAATDDEKSAWQGFCEIESEPAIFNLMLRQWGVRGVKIQEVFSIDPESLMMLPGTVYGLIFLFQYMDDDAGSQENECPSHVWFANQVTNNSCATVALLNMINNIPSLRLGQDLEAFRRFTLPFSPSIRGEQVANYDFIKRVHNSFARKIDMLTADKSLEEDFEEHKRKKSRKNKKSKKSKKAVDDSAFHFVAYMPILGEIWKLDGLDTTPQSIMNLPADASNSFSTEWLAALAPILQTRMADYEYGGIQFNLLALVQDPLVEAQENLLSGLRLAKAAGIEEYRADLESYGLSQVEVEEKGPDDDDQKRLDVCLPDAQSQAEFQKQVKREIQHLQSTVLAEKSATDVEEQKAMDQKNDYGPFIQKWLMLLAEHGVLKDLAEE